MSLAKKYLLVYNTALSLGWAFVLAKYLSIFYPDFNLALSYAGIEIPLKIVQTAAILEVVHSALGLVRSQVGITAVQVSSRLYLVWGIINAFPKIINESFGVPICIFAWSVTEIIRYGYYSSNLIGNVPHFLTWLRYTLFYFLYPLGVTGEIICILAALRYAYGNSNIVKLPNITNIQLGYDWIMIGSLVSYFPFFPQLYCHMIAQRRKILGKSHSN